jgi:uncharacterized SAM-binding protein YcdF (DUF218 family)
MKAPRKSGPPGKADVIIVLGAKVWAGGNPSPAMLRRTLHAVDLYQRGLADVLIVSGGRMEHPPSEAEVMQRIAVEQGISKDNIVMENTARTTLDSAVACSRILRRNGWSTAWLVTDRYHMIRSSILFRVCGVKASGSPPQYREFGPRLWKWWYWHLREFLALQWSLVRVYIQKIKKNDPRFKIQDP